MLLSLLAGVGLSEAPKIIKGIMGGGSKSPHGGSKGHQPGTPQKAQIPAGSAPVPMQGLPPQDRFQPSPQQLQQLLALLAAKGQPQANDPMQG